MKPRRPLFFLTIVGAVMLLGAFSVSITNDNRNAVAFYAGVLGLGLIVVGLAVKRRPPVPRDEDDRV